MIEMSCQDSVFMQRLYFNCYFLIYTLGEIKRIQCKRKKNTVCTIGKTSGSRRSHFTAYDRYRTLRKITKFFQFTIHSDPYFKRTRCGNHSKPTTYTLDLSLTHTTILFDQKACSLHENIVDDFYIIRSVSCRSSWFFLFFYVKLFFFL